ncbi:MAG: universal stress protein [Hyphomicrobiales bacterium]|nr:universal stress protein [Hyphomicrobiales bacterium]
MTLKTIVACLTAPESTPRVAEVALRLAGRHKAHLIALHVIPKVSAYNLAGAEYSFEIVRQQEEVLQEQAAEVEKLFAKAAKSSSAATEWRCEQSPRVDLTTAIRQSIPCADLIVMNQFLGTGVDPEMTADVIIGAGRPALIVPGVGKPREVGKRAMIAWDGKSEAMRAAFDAVPLIGHADSVNILTIKPDGRDRGETTTPGDDLAVALSRHGVKAATVTSLPTEIPVGDALLSSIADESCDLLVMGCYGHTRLRELIFGGVTRHILRHMTVPVLMSH